MKKVFSLLSVTILFLFSCQNQSKKSESRAEAEETKLHHMDGRQFLIANENPFDLIILDAFGSSSIPFHLITTEAFALTKSQLAVGGVLALNLESIGWHDTLVHAVANTLSEVFVNVKVLPMEEPPDQFGNIIIVASDSPLEIDEESLPAPTARWSFEYNQIHAWDNNFIVPAGSGPVLTDDLNMVDLWSVRINLASRQQLHNFFGGEGIDW